MINRFTVLMLLGFGALWQACSKEERDPCLQPRTTVLHARAVRQDTGSRQLDTLLPNPLLFPLTGGVTQYAYGGVKRIATLNFSLSNIADSAKWILRPDSAVALQDTLTFYYDRQLRFLSNACGYTYFYNIQRVTTTTNLIDSAILQRPDVTSDVNVQHVKLVF